MSRRLKCAFTLLIGFVAFQPPLAIGQGGARVVRMQDGLIDCFIPGLARKDGRLVHCEASAAAYFRGRLVIANDKPIPGRGRSPVFTMELYDGVPLTRPVGLHLD